MSKINLTGMGVALITPFKEDESVDYDALANLVEYQIENGTDYLVVLGTTGETPTLTDSEKKEILKCVIKQNAGRKPIILGLGDNCTRRIIEELQTADFTGVDGILSVVPYYNKPTQEGIYQHYKAIAEASVLPIILYNIPGRSGVNMSVETTLRLANEFPNIVATKEASGSIAQIDAIIKNKPASFEVISGDDGITFPLIALGAVGIISVVANALPKEFGHMIRVSLAGDFKKGLKIHRNFEKILSLLFVEGNPAGVKSVLHNMGRIHNTLRLPLVPVTDCTSSKLKTALAELDILYTKVH